MTNLTRASRELFRRTPDETFPSLEVFQKHFQWQREQSVEIWQPPRTLSTGSVAGERLLLDAGNDGAYEMNDWSFGQLCRLSGVAKETVNRLTWDRDAKEQHFQDEQGARGGWWMGSGHSATPLGAVCFETVEALRGRDVAKRGIGGVSRPADGCR